MWIGLALTCATLAAPAPLEKAIPRLSDQVDASTLVCIGAVDEVLTVPFPDGIESSDREFESRREDEFRFARIRVERVLKGDPNTKVAFHEAWPTWICDTTSDETGKRALFLLGPGVIAGARAEDRQRVTRALGSDVVLRNVGSGDGIVPILRDGSHEYVQQWNWIDALRDPEHRKGSSLARVVAWIETSARFAPDVVAVHARCNKPIPLGPEAADTFDLRILIDGRRRLARKLGEREWVVVDRIEPTRWDSLQRMLRDLVTRSELIGQDTPGWHARSLSVQMDDHRLEFRQGWEETLSGFDRREQPGVIRSIRVWAALWSVLDCPTCTDHRAGDEQYLLGSNR